MKANDLSELFKIDFENGRIGLGGSRLLLFSADGMGFLRKDLINTLGDEIGRAILFRLGFQTGYMESINLAKSVAWKNDFERLKAVGRLQIIKGLAQPSEIKIKVKPDKRHFYMEGRWLNSFEAEQHSKIYGVEDHPVCWMLQGFVSGYSSAVMGCTTLCMETGCLGRGDEFCSWQVKPAVEWGQEGKELASFLHSVDLKGRIDLLEQIVDEKTRALKATHEYLLKAEKLIAIGQISSKIAHEMRNPLTVIGGFANLINRRTQLRMPEKKFVEIIISEVGRLERFLNDVLTYSTEFPLEQVELNLNKLLTGVLLLFDKTFIQNGVTVIQNLDEKVPLISGDKKRLEEVFIHLVANAVNAMPQGGVFSLSSSYVPVPLPARVRIEVTDTGVGISKEMLEKIFEPFFTTKTISSGLGLTVSQEILKRHNAIINVSSEANKGTTVIVEFILQYQ